MQPRAATVEQYLAQLPPDRREALQAVRETILSNLDRDYEEGMQYGMIGYYVPHSVFPPGYHCDPKQPLPYAGLASQKNHMSLYMMGMYVGCEPGSETELFRWFVEAWKKTGKKLDMGRACIRFKKLEDVPLAVIGEAVKRTPAKGYVDLYERTLGAHRAGKAAAKPKKPPERGSARTTAPKTSTGKTSTAKTTAAKKGSARPAAADKGAKTRRPAAKRK
jgi:hypothetical protein